jgi:hypothetical protein
MSIQFIHFHIFFRKITRFSYKEIAEEGKKRNCPHGESSENIQLIKLEFI